MALAALSSISADSPERLAGSLWGELRGASQNGFLFEHPLCRKGEKISVCWSECVYVTTTHGRKQKKQVRPWEQGEIEARSLADEQCTKGVKR